MPQPSLGHTWLGPPARLKKILARLHQQSGLQMNAPWQDRNLNPSLLPSKTTAKLLDPESFVKMEESQTFVAQTKKKKPGFKLRWKPQTSQSSSAIIHSCPCKKMAWTRWLMNHREWLLVFQQAGSLLSRLMFLYILRGKSIPSVSAFWVCLHTVERVKSFFWVSFIRMLMPLMWALSPWPHDPPRTSLPNTITLGVKISLCKFDILWTY